MDFSDIDTIVQHIEESHDKNFLIVYSCNKNFFSSNNRDKKFPVRFTVELTETGHLGTSYYNSIKFCRHLSCQFTELVAVIYLQSTWNRLSLRSRAPYTRIFVWGKFHLLNISNIQVPYQKIIFKKNRFRKYPSQITSPSMLIKSYPKNTVLILRLSIFSFLMR